jgi:hypothetical protein
MKRILERPETVLLIGMALLLTGCQIGPRAMSLGHPEYASVVGKLTDEQLLLNLVRLRYRATPVWLEVSSISTQFEASAAGDVSAALNEDVGSGGAHNPDAFGIGAGIAYAERPTISYSILRGEQFTTRLLKPISVNGVSLLADSGWRADRVLLLMAERVNGLKNAPRASGPTPADEPEFRDFQEAARLIWKLDRAGHIDFEASTRVEQISDPIPAANVEGDMLIDAAKSGSEFHLSDDGQTMVLTQEQRVLIMRVAESAQDSPDVARLRDLLKLEPESLRYDLVDPADAEYHPLTQEEVFSNISIDTRSLLGVMYYLSNGIAVPPEDQLDGPVTQTLDEAGKPFDWGELLDGVFKVHSSKQRPSSAAVAVRYRGHWFYIASDDESSLSTFALLNQLDSFTSGERQGAAPVLTLPVGN